MNDDIKEEPSPKKGQLVKKEPESSEIDTEIEELVKEAPPEIREFLEKASPEVRRTVTSFMMKASLGGLPHPLFDKFTPQHVDKFLDLNEEDSKRSFRFACQGRWFAFGSGIVILGFITFLIVYLLPNNKDLLVDLLKILIAFAGGFGAGIGYKSIK